MGHHAPFLDESRAPQLPKNDLLSAWCDQHQSLSLASLPRAQMERHLCRARALGPRSTSNVTKAKPMKCKSVVSGSCRLVDQCRFGHDLLQAAMRPSIKLQGLLILKSGGRDAEQFVALRQSLAVPAQAWLLLPLHL